MRGVWDDACEIYGPLLGLVIYPVGWTIAAIGSVSLSLGAWLVDRAERMMGS